MRKLAVGHHSEARHPAFGKAVLAELVLTFLFAFAGVGGCMAVEQLSVPSASATALIVAAVTHAFIVFAVLSAGLNLSGAHFNPAVTFGLAAGGHVTLFRMIAYWIAQLVGSSLACLLLRYLTGGLDTPVHALAAGMPVMKGVIMEAVLTFGLLFVVYGTLVDPKKGEMSIVGPLSVGLVVGANILAGGSFSGASMNPARSFGPALATGVWTNHWVYWVGPLIGGGLAGLFYENVLVGQPTHLPLRDNDASY